MSLITTHGLTKQFGGLSAVDDVDIDIESGELVSIIGPNGAGKSTLINLITGRLSPTRGEIQYRGTDVTGKNRHELTQLGIGRTYQTQSLFPGLTVRENVTVAAFGVKHGSFATNFLRRRDRYDSVHAHAAAVLERIDLAEKADDLASTLPYGDERRLEIALALATEPEMLFLDEPTAGMSPGETDKTTEILKTLHAEEGVTIALVEHDMDIVFDVSDRIVVIDRGRIIAEGTPDDVKGHPAVREAYLGGDEV
jgi:branched-chain amino acid transport system ATP-binding protein